eukprot:570277-Rhodomonas_salina.1
MSVGQPAPPSVVAVQARKNCACRKAYDPAGHHAQVCGMHGRTVWQRGHKSVWCTPGRSWPGRPTSWSTPGKGCSRGQCTPGPTRGATSSSTSAGRTSWARSVMSPSPTSRWAPGPGDRSGAPSSTTRLPNAWAPRIGPEPRVPGAGGDDPGGALCSGSRDVPPPSAPRHGGGLRGKGMVDERRKGEGVQR